ncbi:MAG: crossover junction endodeoxyribonuclease RuvC [Oscillospiraceae bacterium]|nr:crossover junction endodeoxyribonuclease RuvC [Oscillospiraceae bacterium]
MRILGIDPGYATIGCGALEFDGSLFKLLEYGAITTPADMSFPLRLLKIEEEFSALIERLRPEALSIEKLYFNTNTTTAIDVAQARGVIIAAAARRELEIFEYTPLQVKLAVVGYGRAEKSQVMEMTRVILGLKSVPRPDDAADALALAVCCGHSAAAERRARIFKQGRSGL